MLDHCFTHLYFKLLAKVFFKVKFRKNVYHSSHIVIFYAFNFSEAYCDCEKRLIIQSVQQMHSACAL